MKPEEIAAYIGAAAWAPQIAAWVYRSFLKSKLRIVPDQVAEVGYTTLGPIFNFRMAFFVENKDLIIDEIELTVRHQDGESRNFRWAGIGETFSAITDATGNRQIVSKDQTPIAVKISTQNFLEKNVRFQEPRYHKMDREITQKLVTHFNFLKQKNPNSFVNEVLESKEFFSVINERKKWFWWKPGLYQVALKIRSPQSFQLIEPSFAFELSDLDVELLSNNLDTVRTEIENIINSNIPGAQPKQVQWKWANVNMLRSQDI